MPDTDKILQVLERLENGQKSLQEGQQVLQKTVDQQGKAIAELREGQKTTDLKVEAFHEEQRQANIQILTSLSNVD